MRIAAASATSNAHIIIPIVALSTSHRRWHGWQLRRENEGWEGQHGEKCSLAWRIMKSAASGAQRLRGGWPRAMSGNVLPVNIRIAASSHERARNREATRRLTTEGINN
jgi:hypothetical protein